MAARASSLLILFVTALLVSALGFKRVVYFIEHRLRLLDSGDGSGRGGRLVAALHTTVQYHTSLSKERPEGRRASWVLAWSQPAVEGRAQGIEPVGFAKVVVGALL